MSFNFYKADKILTASAGHFQLDIDGYDSTAFVKSVDGGWPKGNAIEEMVGQDNMIIKHLSTVELPPIEFEMGMYGGTDMLGWIQSSWRRNFARHDGCITHADFDMYASLEHHFYGALITETTFPTLDASSKDGGFLKVKLQPERVEFKQAGKYQIQSNTPSEQKIWACSNFALKLDGLDTKHIFKIDGFTVKQGVKALYTGEDRFPQWEPTNIKFPDVSIHMSKIHAGSIMAWYDQFVIKGKKDPASEKSGAIEFLAPNKRDVIYRIRLANVGIKAFSVDKSTANEEAMKRVKFDLYVGSMDIDGDGMLSLE